jgi:allophanate hydrolase
MMLSADAKPYTFSFDPTKTALLLIDFQRDFLESGGFGDVQGGNLAAVQASVRPATAVLALARRAGLTIVHTREGHEPGLRDCPTCKLTRQANAPDSKHTVVIGGVGPKGSRLLVRGEYMHDLIDQLKPILGEFLIDKPGKGAFYATELHQILVNGAVSHLIIVGVTTECCVTTTLREANDRGFECLLVSDATDGYVPEFKDVSLSMITFSEGLFGYVCDSASILAPLEKYAGEREAAAPMTWDGSMDIQTLKSLYAKGLITPEDVVNEVYKRLNRPAVDPAVWLHVFPHAEAVRRARELSKAYPDPAARHPLFGIPFSVKDSIDIKGVPTTAACPQYAYVAEKDAPSFAMLIEAGCIVIGKVNLDQLATGLVGMRSPYGQPASVFSSDYVSGGSSTGSCVSVASNQVSFSLATDTAGSGRIPSAFNNIIGFKPTRGTITVAGVVPCCLSLDCIAIEASTVADARIVWSTLFHIDEEEPFSKVSRPSWALAPRAVLQPKETFKFAIPPVHSESRNLVTTEFNQLFEAAVHLVEEIGGQLVSNVDYTVFENAGRLLYEGSFVAERVSGVREWYDAHPVPTEPGVVDPLLPEIRAIYSAAANNFSAVDAWSDALKMMNSQRLAQVEYEKIHVLVVPTAPIHPTKAQYLADPIALNHKLGKFTHYANILDLTGVSCPAGFTEYGMPFAITILGPSFSDGMVLEIAQRFEAAFCQPAGINGKRAALGGQPVDSRDSHNPTLDV